MEEDEKLEFYFQESSHFNFLLTSFHQAQELKDQTRIVANLSGVENVERDYEPWS